MGVGGINTEYDSLSAMARWSILHGVDERVLEILWRRFSEIQCATYLIVDTAAADRFFRWVKTGDDDEAWS